MPVTEVAILPLSRPLTAENPTLPSSLIKKLKTAKKVLEQASGHTFHYFQQLEDPSFVYLLGKWDSVSAHTAFLPSPENQSLLELLKQEIVMDGKDGKEIKMWHLNTDIFPLEVGQPNVFTAPVISLNRHLIPAEKKAGFGVKFNEVKGILQEFTKPFPVVGGWRIEREGVEGKEREEWALFSGFESVKHHHEFPKTEAFAEYREIIGFVEGFEVRHLTAIGGL